MKIEEIRDLIEQENNGDLRIPYSLIGEDRLTTYKIHKAFKIIVDDLVRNPLKDIIIENPEVKRHFKEAGLFKVEKIFDNYLDIHTSFGSGVVCNAHVLFEYYQYPTHITPGYCFSNAFLYVMTKEPDAKVLSGIAFVGKPFLHSVVLCHGMIIDFNYDLIMSKELYFALTHFEVLEVLDSQAIIDNKEVLIDNKHKLKDVNYAELNFAFEEVLDLVKENEYVLLGGVMC